MDFKFLNSKSLAVARNARIRSKRHILFFDHGYVKPAFINDHIGSPKNWYQRGKNFWDKSQATYNGVLNGYGSLSQIDIQGSSNFLNKFLDRNPNFHRRRVLDCGAGIGRITKQLLSNIFDKVDLIDQCEKFIDQAKILLKDKNIGHFYAKGLQQFQFEEKYDCVWVQWVLAQLTDKDAQIFLTKAKQSLSKNGIIVVKENHADENEGFIVDKDDGSISRSPQMYRNLFEKVQMKLIMEQSQKQWPQDLQSVRMYILQQM